MTTQTMIERVAKAIDAVPTAPNEWANSLNRARAALQALREPTEEMVAAGGDLRDADYQLIEAYMAEEVFHAMIDAALQEEALDDAPEERRDTTP